MFLTCPWYLESITNTTFTTSMAGDFVDMVTPDLSNMVTQTEPLESTTASFYKVENVENVSGIKNHTFWYFVFDQ